MLDAVRTLRPDARQVSPLHRYLISFCGGITVVAIASIVARSGNPGPEDDLSHEMTSQEEKSSADLVAARRAQAQTQVEERVERPTAARLSTKQIVDAKIAAATTAQDPRFESAMILPTKRRSGNPALDARARALGLRGQDATKLRDWMQWKENVESDALRSSKDYPTAERAKVYNDAALRIRRDLVTRFGADKAQEISKRIPLRRMDDQGAIHRTDAHGGRIEQSDDAKDECDT